MSLLPPVLLVDDSADDRELVSLVLAGAFGPVAIEEASDAVALARAVSAGRFGLVLTEHELPWIRSVDVVRLVRDLRPGCPVIVLSGQPIERVASEILHLTPDGLVPKTSAGLASLPRAVRAALYRTRRRDSEGTDAPHRRLLDALPIGVFVAAADGTLLDVNPSFATGLGFARPEEAVHRAFDGLFATPAEGEAFRAGLAVGAPPAAIEARLRRSDGAPLWARIVAWRRTEPESGAERLEGLLEERGAARAAEAELAERTAALARSNGELDEMAYVVSHDLRKPLTRVVRFLDLLETDAGERLGREERGLLEQARQSARGLEGMVEAVLRCARIDSHGEPLTEVDLDAVADRVLGRVEGELAALGGRVRREPLPTVRADPAQIEQLFENLIDNALKFRGGEPPRIEIEATPEGESWHLRFRDHGVGLDPADAERVFVMFQRLHTSAEVPGSGIGLAVCRRIVARHGGRIWVESRPGEGATFHVTLPREVTAPAGGRRQERA